MIIDAYDGKTEAIINPSDIISRVEYPELAVITFSPHITEALTVWYSPVQIDEMFAGIRVPVYKILHKRKPIAVYCTTIGGAAAAGLLEEIIAKGVKKALFFGACGVLDKSIAPNTLVVPTEAYRDEGLSYHYAPPSDYIKVRTAMRLSDTFNAMDRPHVRGRTWTNDAFYRETRGNMEKRRAEGCVSVEMECASVMAVADFRGVEVYQFFYAADCLDAEKWDERTLGSLPKSEYERLLRLALETIIRL